MGHVSNFFPVFFVGVSTKPSISLSNPSSVEVTIAEVAVIDVSCVFFFHSAACMLSFFFTPLHVASIFNDLKLVWVLNSSHSFNSLDYVIIYGFFI